MKQNSIVTYVSIKSAIKDGDGFLPKGTIGTILGDVPRRSGIPRTFKPLPISRRKVTICSEFLEKIKLNEEGVKK